ncbi:MULTISPECIES: hypothetical protein [Flavobacteriaceae]|uniref:hypothetical protein n=1 Tax=Flavobacteriaceae TaxID=49546 RepID=UPI0014909537|nr:MULTISPECIES: hypothetical protein [Allomuricauda]MDC6365864.1 hypothetical protein [Muricauda sp. AC10]
MKTNIKKSDLRLWAIAMLCCAVLTKCNKKNLKQDHLLGAWKVDSTFTYYNGFSSTKTKEGGDWGICVYSKDSIMRESKYGTYRSFYYSFSDTDSLFLSSTNNAKDTVRLQILALDKKQLVLKIPKKPIFESDGFQERYEIRYHSRTDTPSGKLSVLRGYKE